MDQFLKEAGLACIRYILAPIIGNWVTIRLSAKTRRRISGRRNSRKG